MTPMNCQAEVIRPQPLVIPCVLLQRKRVLFGRKKISAAGSRGASCCSRYGLARYKRRAEHPLDYRETGGPGTLDPAHGEALSAWRNRRERPLSGRFRSTRIHAKTLAIRDRQSGADGCRMLRRARETISPTVPATRHEPPCGHPRARPSDANSSPETAGKTPRRRHRTRRCNVATARCHPRSRSVGCCSG